MATGAASRSPPAAATSSPPTRRSSCGATASGGGHWLELDLRGPAANAQAIGASAKARIGERWIHQWVGQNDDSRHSSGHYRLYFGLGKERRIDKLVVAWPDGTKRVLRDLRADRILRIAPSGAVRVRRP